MKVNGTYLGYRELNTGVCLCKIYGCETNIAVYKCPNIF